MNKASAAVAPRTVSSSPFGWNSRCAAVGASRIGATRSWPSSESLVSIAETSTRNRGASLIRCHAAVFHPRVCSSPLPPAR